ncbi:MAG TPA: LOG family protein [Anaerolineales bacterium]|nr:LOG family protein [Anaerolineales bacterium]
MRVTVFGGAEPKPGEPAYEEALRLGRLIGSAGHTVLTGGYIGTMEAVSRGVAESGGHVIGVTCEQIEAWRPVSPNPWVQEEQRFVTIQQRLSALIENCDAALALPGGIGTLAEIAVMWSSLQTGALSPRPLILIGPGWRAVFDLFIDQQSSYVTERHRRWLLFAPDVESAFRMLDHSKIES